MSMSYSDHNMIQGAISSIAKALHSRSKGQNARAALAAAVANYDQPMPPDVLIAEAEQYLRFLNENNT